MKINKIYCISAFLILYVSSPVFAQTYTLKGNLTGIESDSLFILKYKRGGVSGEKIPAAGGSFQYSDTISEPYFIQILTISKVTNQTSGKIADVLVEAGEININGPASDFSKINITGSKSDLILKEYLSKDMDLQKEWHKLKVVYDKYVNTGDSLNRKKVALKLNSINYKERIPLLKVYVKKYRGEIIGALIPNFCTLSDILSKQDYLEMFEYLTQEMKISAYGKSILNKSASAK